MGGTAGCSQLRGKGQQQWVCANRQRSFVISDLHDNSQRQYSPTDLRVPTWLQEAYIRADAAKTVWIFTTQPIKIRCSGKRNSVVAGNRDSPTIHDTQNDSFSCFP